MGQDDKNGKCYFRKVHECKILKTYSGVSNKRATRFILFLKITKMQNFFQAFLWILSFVLLPFDRNMIFWSVLSHFIIRNSLDVIQTLLGLQNYRNLEEFSNLHVYSIQHVYLTP